MNILLGAHSSINGGYYKAIERADNIGCTVTQIFTKNSNQWKAKSISIESVIKFKDTLKNSKINEIIAHDSYLINLCAKDKEILKKSKESFIEELKACEILGIPHLNFHPGSHLGQGESDGIKIIAESINIAHLETHGSKVCTMIETTAGQGTNIGYKFEQIGEIIGLIEDKTRMTVCIDTCHIFAAGYEINNAIGYDKTFLEFHNCIGLDYLKAFHINDSKKPLNSRVDRHEHIGKGFIGPEAFRLLMNDKRFINIPKILETPKSEDMNEDIMNMNLLKSFIVE